MQSLKIAAILALFTTSIASAATPTPSFSDREISESREKGPLIAQTASACLDRYWAEHDDFYKLNNYSKFYGNRQSIYASPDSRKLALLEIKYPDLYRFPAEVKKAMLQAKQNKVLEQKARELGVDVASFSEEQKKNHTSNVAVTYTDYLNYLAKENPALAAKAKSVNADLAKREKELKNISCVDLSRRCLGEAFAKADMNETWTKIDRHMKLNGVSGVEMQKSLVKIGWTSFYWNADTSKNGEADVEDVQLTPLEPTRRWMPVWGGHRLRCIDVNNRNSYFGIPIQNKHTLVNFGKTLPENFKRVPFFVGTAHSGYHVFPGKLGRVIEAHSKRKMADHDNLEFSDFNPLDQEHLGGPRWTNTEHYRSGVIVVPPGTFRDEGENGPIDCGKAVDVASVDGGKTDDGQTTQPTQPAVNPTPVQPAMGVDQQKFERLWTKMNENQRMSYRRMSSRKQKEWLRRNGIDMDNLTDPKTKKKSIFGNWNTRD